MGRVSRTGLAAVLALTIMACGDEEPPGAGEACAVERGCIPPLACRGNPPRCIRLALECEPCTQDADCANPLVCVGFSDGSRRCASGVGASTCRVGDRP
jgi:hypothetical protein